MKIRRYKKDEYGQRRPSRFRSSFLVIPRWRTRCAQETGCQQAVRLLRDGVPEGAGVTLCYSTLCRFVSDFMFLDRFFSWSDAALEQAHF